MFTEGKKRRKLFPESADEEEYKTFSAMVGFRNKMVHLYQTISDERVYEFSTSELGDFEIFIERISTLISQSFEFIVINPV